MAGKSQMKRLLKVMPLCWAILAGGGCDSGAKSGVPDLPGKSLEIRGYRLGMSEKMVLGLGGGSCSIPSEKLEADNICSTSTDISGQPGILFFYFIDNKLEKLALTVLPKHGYLPEINKVFFQEFEAKYGKPASNNTLAITWLQKEGALTVSHNDERTVTIHLVSSKYEDEKARRAKKLRGEVEI